MKRIVVSLITFCLLMGLTVPAYAEDEVVTGQEFSVVVSTLEELKSAIDAAEDGDIVRVSSTISINEDALECDKQITITRADDFDSAPLFKLYGNSELNGLNILESANCAVEIYASTDTAILENCFFEGTSENESPLLHIWGIGAKAVISNCQFSNNGHGVILSKANTSTEILDCAFTGNSTYGQGGAINNAGTMKLSNCFITNNYAGSGGGVFNSGEIEINDCRIMHNTTNDKFGSDVFSTGKLTIYNNSQNSAGFYEESTGVKIELPLIGYANSAKLIWLTTEQAAEYFAPEETDDPDDTEDNEQNGSEDNRNPNEPDEGEPDNPAETPSEQPEQPDNGEDEDTTPPESEEPPTTPSEPQDKSDDGNDDYEPPVYRPVRPTKPVKPEPQPEPAPALVCNEAVIDTSRSVVLLGYGDGLLHEDDPLTRAQLATIIYRLLDDDSIAQYDTDGAAQFNDIAPDAWYYRFVQTINRAGIVVGVGEGNYAPDGLVTWAQTVTILSRFVEPQDCELQHIQYDGWAVDAVQTAVSLGWIEDSAEFNPDAVISRGQLVNLLNDVLAMYR